MLSLFSTYRKDFEAKGIYYEHRLIGESHQSHLHEIVANSSQTIWWLRRSSRLEASYGPARTTMEMFRWMYLTKPDEVVVLIVRRVISSHKDSALWA